MKLRHGNAMKRRHLLALNRISLLLSDRYNPGEDPSKYSEIGDLELDRRTIRNPHLFADAPGAIAPNYRAPCRIPAPFRHGKQYQKPPTGPHQASISTAPRSLKRNRYSMHAYASRRHDETMRRELSVPEWQEFAVKYEIGPAFQDAERSETQNEPDKLPRHRSHDISRVWSRALPNMSFEDFIEHVRTSDTCYCLLEHHVKNTATGQWTLNKEPLRDPTRCGCIRRDLLGKKPELRSQAGHVLGSSLLISQKVSATTCTSKSFIIHIYHIRHLSE